MNFSEVGAPTYLEADLLFLSFDFLPRQIPHESGESKPSALQISSWRQAHDAVKFEVGTGHHGRQNCRPGTEHGRLEPQTGLNRGRP